MKKNRSLTTKAKISSVWTKDMESFLEKFPDCFVINPKSVSEISLLLRKTADLNGVHSRKIAISTFHQKNCAITAGRKHRIVTSELVREFAKKTGASLDELLEGNIIAYYGLAHWQQRQINRRTKKTPKATDGKAEHINSWADKTKKTLLSSSTRAERFLYSSLPKNVRQYANKQHYIIVGGKQYFIDIYLCHLKRAIEVDGGYHKEYNQSIKDARRDEQLASIGIKTYRIANEDVFDPIKRNAFIRRVLST